MNLEEVFSYEHLFDSARKCCRGVRWKHSTQMFEINMSKWIARLRKQLLNGTYKSIGFTEFDIHERGKKRHIQAIHISERCVQKCLCEYCLKPLLQPKLIYDNSANIKGKGTEFAIKRLKKHLAYHFKKHGRNGGILLIDYHNYFQSINHEILLEMLEPLIEDKRIYYLLKSFIEDFGDVGLGLGSEISQILAVFYRNRIDHYIKEKLHIKGYGAYMDDSYLIHHDIDYLNYCLTEVRRISGELGLTLNEEKSMIVSLNDGFAYLKKRFRIAETGRILVRLDRSNIQRNRAKYKKMERKGISTDTSFACWEGYAKHYDSYETVNNMRQVVRTERNNYVYRIRKSGNYEDDGVLKKGA